ncbi:hypothetical protein D779_1308 [Imhoffiella purpurea]|uniref:Uncharacterized protein n=1 Tax=Imhoffiella purpurea TaxID=1249627 RepID=W9VEZ8_9GAMM|nr:hypothetical protein D779_1308 [Imhoffiella purpurea]
MSESQRQDEKQKAGQERQTRDGPETEHGATPLIKRTLGVENTESR